MAVRKASIVALGVFGSLTGVEGQTHIGLMLLLIFLGIHLAFAPYDVASPRYSVLHHMDTMALAVCWSTLWAGLLFFRGDLGMGGSIFVSICILVVNTAFALWGCIRLVRELALENDIVGKVIRIGKRFSRNGASETSNTSGNPLYGKVRSDIRKPKEIAEKERDKSGEERKPYEPHCSGNGGAEEGGYGR